MVARYHGMSTYVARGRAALCNAVQYSAVCSECTAGRSTLAGVTFSLPIPVNCNLVGVNLCAQVASVNVASVALTNALDLTIGSF